jgi:hypothetical protein
VIEHPEIRDLIGPYVLGDLDPAEERAVEGHLEGCPSCRQEAESLRLVHEHLLDFAATSEAPPLHLKDRAIADLPRPALRRALPPWLVVAAAVLLVALGLAYGPSLLGDQRIAAATLEPTAEAPDAGGELEIRGSGENVEVSLEAWGLPPCESEEYYELWFVEEGERVSAGTFSIGQSGDAQLSLNAPRFATTYPRVGITVERDGDPHPSETKMLAGQLKGS